MLFFFASASASVSRFPILCGPLCVERHSFWQCSTGFRRCCSTYCRLHAMVVALSASGRVGERWFHMFDVVGVCWVCSMLVVALISSYVASFLLFLEAGRTRGSLYPNTMIESKLAE
jgi:hypothetical protein